MTYAIQTASLGVASSSTTPSLSLSAVTAGNSLLLIGISAPNGFAQSWGNPTDSNGTWPAATINVAANTQFGLQVWLLNNAAAGTHNISLGSGAVGDVLLLEIPPTTGIDVHPYTLTTSNTATSLSQSATTTVTDNLLALFAYSDATSKSAIDPSNPTGWTSEMYQPDIYNGTISQNAYRVSSLTSQPAGAYSASFSFTNNAYYSVEITAILALKVGGGGATYNQSVSGTITPTGGTSIRVVITMVFAGAVTATGALAKRIATSLSGSITATGTMAKRAGKSLAGSVTGSGSLNRSTSTTLSGSTAPAGALSETAVLQKSLSGAITLTTTIATVLIHGGGAAKRAMTQIALFLGIRL